jgi:large subunit ribosomal protein L4
VKESNLLVLEDFTFDSPKTKNVSELLKNFQLTGKKILVVVNSPDDNLLLAARNMKRVKIVRTADLNTYEILDAKQVLMTESSIPEIVKIHQN